MLWLPLLATLSLQAPPAADAAGELDRLRKENAELKEQLSALEQNTLEDARTIQRLRQALKAVNTASAEPAPAKPATAPAKKPDLGPTKVVRGKLVYVDARNGFVTIGIGKPHGVRPGYRFEIMRETYEPGSGEAKITRLGLGECEKFMGNNESMAKLIITEGDIAEMRVEDLAVAVRQLSPVSEKPAPGDVPADPAAAPETPVPGKDGLYAITGRAGIGVNAGYILNYGSQHGARQTDLVYVYDEDQLKAKLRLDRVDKGYSVANVVDGSMQVAPEVGDKVHIREIRKSLTGKVALADDKRGVLAVDLRTKDGVEIGQRFEVRRQGKKIGTIVITEVLNWGSWARPEEGTTIDQLTRGDFVEVIPQ